MMAKVAHLQSKIDAVLQGDTAGGFLKGGESLHFFEKHRAVEGFEASGLYRYERQGIGHLFLKG